MQVRRVDGLLPLKSWPDANLGNSISINIGQTLRRLIRMRSDGATGANDMTPRRLPWRSSSSFPPLTQLSLLGVVTARRAPTGSAAGRRTIQVRRIYNSCGGRGCVKTRLAWHTAERRSSRCLSERLCSGSGFCGKTISHNSNLTVGVPKPRTKSLRHVGGSAQRPHRTRSKSLGSMSVCRLAVIGQRSGNPGRRSGLYVRVAPF